MHAARYGAWRSTDDPGALLIFQEIDVDGSGFIDHMELKLALEARGVSPDGAAKLMAQMDVDGDGKVPPA